MFILQASSIISSKSLVLQAPLPLTSAAEIILPAQPNSDSHNSGFVTKSPAVVSSAANSPLSPSSPMSATSRKAQSGSNNVEKKRKRVEINRTVVALDWNNDGSRLVLMFLHSQPSNWSVDRLATASYNGSVSVWDAEGKLCGMKTHHGGFLFDFVS